MPQTDYPALLQRLQHAQEGLDLRALRDRDPVSAPWRFEDPRDQEVIALIAATLAYGRVDLLRAAIERAIAHLGPRPAEALEHLSDAAHRRHLRGFVYRMTDAEDLAALYRALGAALRERGGLLPIFEDALDPQAPDLRAPLTRLVHDLRRRGESTRRGFYYLLADPARGGACKRLNLYLRWMVRGPDAIDLGLWSHRVAPRQLVMPLDTHVQRICRGLGIATRKTADWQLAAEIAGHLRRLDPEDPIRFDFAICHLGISGAW